MLLIGVRFLSRTEAHVVQPPQKTNSKSKSKPYKLQVVVSICVSFFLYNPIQALDDPHITLNNPSMVSLEIA